MRNNITGNSIKLRFTVYTAELVDLPFLTWCRQPNKIYMVYVIMCIFRQKQRIEAKDCAYDMPVFIGKLCIHQ